MQQRVCGCQAQKELSDVIKIESQLSRCRHTLAQAKQRKDASMQQKARTKLASLEKQYNKEWKEVIAPS